MPDMDLYYKTLDEIVANVLTEMVATFDNVKDIVLINMNVKDKSHLAIYHIAKILEALDYINLYGKLTLIQKLQLKRFYKKKNSFYLNSKLPEHGATLDVAKFFNEIKEKIDDIRFTPTILEEVYDEFYNPLKEQND